MMTTNVAVRQGTRHTLSLIAGLFATLASTCTAFAQAWPSKNITTIVPFAAGSASDVIPRLVLDQVSKQVGKTFVVENRSGAGGTIGNNAVAKSAPDGYTILASAALATAPGLYPNLPYDTLRDFLPVIPLGQGPIVLVTAPSKGFKTLGDLIAAAKAKRGALNFASAGIGSVSHFAAERLRLSAGFEAQHIPFRGATEGLTEVLAGRVDFFFIPLAPALALVNDGRLIALAVSTTRRATALPHVPTTAEAGLLDSAYEFSIGLFLPAKTPSDIAVRLHKETATALQTPAVQERLAQLGFEPMPMSQEQFATWFRRDVEGHARLVKVANIRLPQ
jgi:tripartite-type tricarboxylate transporter receptor subunit TctC